MPTQDEGARYVRDFILIICGLVLLLWLFLSGNWDKWNNAFDEWEQGYMVIDGKYYPIKKGGLR